MYPEKFIRDMLLHGLVLVIVTLPAVLPQTTRWIWGDILLRAEKGRKRGRTQTVTPLFLADLQT